VIPPQILTASGSYFDFLSPDSDTIVIEDIAIALSRINRFTGHTRVPYSVAQHSYIVSLVVPLEYALQGLLHDASEAYLGDVSTPLKQLVPEYKVIERRVEEAIMRKFGLPFPLHPSIKQADLRMLVTEKRDLMPRPVHRWDGDDRVAWSDFRSIRPFDFIIEPVSSEVAASFFLHRFRELTSPGTSKGNHPFYPPVGV
jgi:uncharacterized protein